MYNHLMSILIKDTTREEREKIVAESIGNISGSCDGCMSGLVEMYQDYIDGKKEIRDINMEFSAQHTAVADDFDEVGDGRSHKIRLRIQQLNRNGTAFINGG